MPYKDLAAFRRSYRTKEGCFAHKRSHNLLRDYKEYQSVKDVLKDEAPKTLAKFQELKYNNSEQNPYTLLKQSVADTKVRNLIGTEELPLKIHADKQGKHITTAKTFDKVKQKSFLKVTDEKEALKFAQDIVNQYHGTGEFKYSRDGVWQKRERVLTDKVVGFVYDKEGNLVETKAVTIHYSKKGTHIVPTIIGDKKQ